MESRVLVVGAGLAGISAARELSHRGYQVTVLEGRDRVGGRLWSSNLDGTAIDLGAAFIHGVDQNPVAALAQELGLTLVPMNDCKISDIDGRPVTETTDQRVQGLWNKVLDECAEKQKQAMAAAAYDSRGETSEESNGEGSSSSAGSEAAESDIALPESHVHASSADGTSEATPTDADGDTEDGGGGSQIAADAGPKLKRRARRSSAPPRRPASLGMLLEETARVHVANFSKAEHELWGWHRGNLEISCGADLNELDHLHWNQDDVYDFDGDHVVIKEGYAALSSRVAATLDIRLNNEVKSIKIDEGKSCVEVVVNSEGKTTSMRAGYVVVTLPLGVLKSRLVSFTPALPNAKLAAIRSMGMGTLNKVVLHFSSAFWEPTDFFGHAGKDRRKWLLFMDMSRVTNRPILVAMSGGPFAVLVERLGDAEIVRRAMAVIRTIHPGAPDPTASQVTRWKADRFSRGSFSFIPPGCSAAEYDALAEPVYDRRGQPRVLFAGEATTRYHPSTVHGAWLTGLREATRLDVHARAAWHPKGHRYNREDDFSPDVMYETSVLFDPKRVPRAGSGVRRGKGKVRLRPSQQSDGTDCRRSPRLDAEDGQQAGKRRKAASTEGPAGSLRRLPHRLDDSPEAETHDRFRNVSNERRKLPLGRPARVSRVQELENVFAGGRDVLLAKRS